MQHAASLLEQPIIWMISQNEHKQASRQAGKSGKALQGQT
jgi:hypothetical protein